MVKNLSTAGLVLACFAMLALPAPALDVYFENWESANSRALNNYLTGGAGTFQIKVSNNANHTPGGAYCLNTHNVSLDGNVDWVSTGPLNASGIAGQWYVAFWYMQNSTSNFEADDWMRIRWSTDGATWNTVWEINDDPPTTAWRYGIVEMPAGAISATLYLRFEMDESGTNERWYLDDIYVGDAPPNGGNYAVARVSNLGYPAGGGPITNAVTVTVTGSTGPSPSFVCTQTLPLDLTNVVPVASLGSAVLTAGNELVWTIPGGLNGTTLPQTLTYTCDVPSTVCLTDFPTPSVYDDGYLPIRTIAATWGSEGGVLGMNYSLANRQAVGMQPSNGLAASSPAAAGANVFKYDVGWAGDPQFPGDSLWYNCLNGFAVYGGGTDIWQAGDHCQFVCFAVEGDFHIAADVEIVQPFDNWTKAGIMARQNLGARAIYFMELMRGQDGQSRAQWRLEENNDNSTSTNGGDLGYGFKTPLGLRSRFEMKREGTSMSLGWLDLDNPASSAPLGTWIERDMPQLPNRVLLGFPLTSHNNARIAWATYSNIQTTATFSTYAPIGVPARSISVASYYPGTPFTVSVNVPIPVDGQLTVVENVPAGVSVSNISAGGTLSGSQITWVVAATAPSETVSYDVTALLPQRPLNFVGGYARDEMLFIQNTPDSLLMPQGVIATFQQGVYPDATYAGCADNHIIENTVLSNQGAWDHAEEGDWFGTTEGTGLDDHKKIVIKFDLSSLAPGFEAGVSQALLGLYFDAQRRGGIALESHYLSAARLLKEWVEGTGNTSDGPTALPGESNWMSAQSGVLDWETSGAMGVTDVADFEPASWWNGQLNQWVMLNVTQSAKAMIATAGSTDDQGWKVSQDKLRGVYDNTPGNEYVRGAYDAASRQNGQAWRRPMLILLGNTAYAPPAGVTRTVPATYQWGVAIPIQIDVAFAGGPGSVLTITEDLPAGLDATNVSAISGGGAVVGNQIVWSGLAFTANVQVTYQLTVSAANLQANRYSMYPLVIPGGQVTDNAGASLAIGPSSIKHAGVTILQDGVLPDASYTGCQEAHIITYQKTFNTGGTPIFEEGDWDGRQLGTGTGDHKKLLIQFDLSGVTIPGGQTYQSATLWLYLLRQERGDMYNPSLPFDAWEHAGNQDHALFVWPILKAWNQGNKNNRDGILATDNEVTWNYANTTDTVTPTPGTPWEIPGAMGAADVFDATAIVGTPYETFTWVDIPTTDSQTIGIWVPFDVTRSVQQFLLTPAANHGWKISQDDMFGVPDNDPANVYEMGAYQFVSSENAQADQRPYLEIRTDAAVPVEVSKFIVW